MMKKNFKKLTLVFTLVSFVAGCTHFELVPPGKSDVEGGITVNSDIAWSRYKSGKFEMWTLDGLTLQQMYFAAGIEDGNPIFKISAAGGDERIPLYTTGMNAIELKELFEASLGQLKAQKVKITSFKPAKFDTNPGYSINFLYTLKEGLEMQSIGLFSVKDEKFYMALYAGSRIYHFDRNLADAKKILNSVKFN